jgi:hypothetical protein
MIRIHTSQLKDKELLAKLGIKTRKKPRELERVESCFRIDAEMYLSDKRTA